MGAQGEGSADSDWFLALSSTRPRCVDRATRPPTSDGLPQSFRCLRALTRCGDSERAAASASSGQVKNLAEKPFIRNRAARLDAMTGSSSTIKMHERGDTWGLFRVFLRVRQLSRVSVFLGLTRVLFTIAHVSESPTGRRGELLRTDSGRDRCQYGGMKKKRNNPRESPRTTIASIKREMQKPRLTESVRNDGRDQVAPVAEQPPNSPCGSARL
jgi:hypothetical protein